MKKKTIAIVLAILFLCFLVAAVTWSPQGNIDLKNRYSIVNATEVNFTKGGYIYDNGTAVIIGHK